MNDAMYEHAATRANLETLRARGVEVLEPGTGALGSPGEWGVGRLPEPAELLAAIEARLGAAQGGSARRRCASSSPPAARASRSTPCASSATAAPAGWAGRSPRRPPAAAPRSPSSPPTWGCRAQPGIDYVDVSTAAELAAACRERFPAADVLLMAAAVADYRPASAREDKIKKADAGETLALELERTEDVLTGARRRAPPRPAARRLRRRARRPARSSTRATSSSASASTPSSSTTSPRRVSRSTPPTTRSRSSPRTGKHHVPRATKAAVAAKVLDAVLSRRSSSDVKVSS